METPKRPRGRPPSGRDPLVRICVPLPREQITAFDKVAQARGVSRSALMREMVQSALLQSEERRKIQAVGLVVRVIEFAEEHPDLWDYIKQTQPDMIQKLRDFFGDDSAATQRKREGR